MKHSALDLRYRLIAGSTPPSLEPLRILCSRTFDWQGWRVTVCILGASHAVRLVRIDAAASVTELLTCAPPPSGSGPAWLERAIPAAAECIVRETLHLPGVFLCDVRLTTFPLSEGDALHGDYAPECTLTADFPCPVPNHSAPPRTRLGWRLTPSGLEWETVHTYPEESRCVRSRTRLAVPAAAGTAAVLS